MKRGQAFELLIKHILINIGFSEVKSDGLYVFDGAPGQMIQGLGEAHNTDVLLEPPVQTPFFTKTRLVVECKEYKHKVGLNTLRSALGLREDINHFDIVDCQRLLERRRQNRKSILYTYERYSYQVVVASITGFTVQAQEFAASHRIPLLQFNKMPFWDEVSNLFEEKNYTDDGDFINEYKIINLAYELGKNMAVAITNSGQLLFLYRSKNEARIKKFADKYTLHWIDKDNPWILNSDGVEYVFQLPDRIAKHWLDNANNDISLRKSAMNCKEEMLSNMVVYYKIRNKPTIKLISISKDQLARIKEEIDKINN